MIFSMAQTTGWTIEYITELSPQQIILLSKASEQLFNTKDDTVINADENPELAFASFFGTDMFTKDGDGNGGDS